MSKFRTKVVLSWQNIFKKFATFMIGFETIVVDQECDNCGWSCNNCIFFYDNCDRICDNCSWCCNIWEHCYNCEHSHRPFSKKRPKTKKHKEFSGHSNRNIIWMKKNKPHADTCNFFQSTVDGYPSMISKALWQIVIQIDEHKDHCPSTSVGLLSHFYF